MLRRSPIRRCAACLTLAVCCARVCGSPSALAQDPDGLAAALAVERAIVQAVEQCEHSVVSIARIKPLRREVAGNHNERPNAAFPPVEEDPDDLNYVPNDFGAGIILGGDPAPPPGKTFILTNYHVVKGGLVEGQEKIAAYRLHVRMSNRRGYDARIYAADPRSDLAILLIDEADAKPIKLGDATHARKGQLVLALGNPYAIARDGSASVSWGIISNLTRKPDHPKGAAPGPKQETIQHLGNLLQVDTRLNLGTSGGALVNLRGELIGITTALAALEGYEKSVGYAVPIDETTLRIIKTLRAGREVEYGFLGVKMSPHPVRRVAVRRTDKRGAVVERVLGHSPAARGGILADDCILAVNDKPVFSRIDLTREISKLPPDDKARLKVVREPGEQYKTVTVELGKWPVQDEEGIVAPRRRFEPWRGLVVDYATARHKYSSEYIESADTLPQGTLIMEVIPRSPAAAAELEPGKFVSRVNEVPVTTPKQFYDAVKSLHGDVTLHLLGGGAVTIRGP